MIYIYIYIYIYIVCVCISITGSKRSHILPFQKRFHRRDQDKKLCMYFVLYRLKLLGVIKITIYLTSPPLPPPPSYACNFNNSHNYSPVRQTEREGNLSQIVSLAKLGNSHKFVIE